MGKLTEYQREQIRARAATGRDTHADIARDFGVSRSLVSGIARGAKRAYNPQNSKRTNTRIKWQALSHYSDVLPVCRCCGETIFDFLCIDHINGGGNQHRRNEAGSKIYWWLKREGYPEGFQVLCMNCNFGKALLGQCPHSLTLQEREIDLADRLALGGFNNLSGKINNRGKEATCCKWSHPFDEENTAWKNGRRRCKACHRRRMRDRRERDPEVVREIQRKSRDKKKLLEISPALIDELTKEEDEVLA